MSQPVAIKQKTEMEQKFLDALFGDAAGDIPTAMRIAGYAKTTRSTYLIRALKDDLIELCKIQLALNSPKAVIKLIGVLDDPTALGNREKITAIKEILDRAGLVRVDKIEHSTGESNVIFMLPPKKPLDEDTEVLLETDTEASPA